MACGWDLRRKILTDLPGLEMRMEDFCLETLNSVPVLRHCGPGKTPCLSELQFPQLKSQ